MKALFQKAESAHNARPAPPAVARRHHIDLQHIAGLRTFNPDGPGQGMDAGSVDVEVLRSRHAWPHLAAARIYAFHLHFVSGLDAQPRLKSTDPIPSASVLP